MNPVDNIPEALRRQIGAGRVSYVGKQLQIKWLRGGQIVQSIRSDTGAHIRILQDVHLPPCALNSNELVQISGDAATVKKALSDCKLT
ncbi:hypothetical protein K1719_013334 [Acacia pycnantha]|nr:hypothetical protein K1719_013334 [Acacia pycnantha]